MGFVEGANSLPLFMNCNSVNTKSKSLPINSRFTSYLATVLEQDWDYENRMGPCAGSSEALQGRLSNLDGKKNELLGILNKQIFGLRSEDFEYLHVVGLVSVEVKGSEHQVHLVDASPGSPFISLCPYVTTLLCERIPTLANSLCI